jgi:hypothetical protein
MFECGKSMISGAVLLGAVTVYNNFGAQHDGWDYNWGLGWTVAGENVPAQYGVEQAMGFTPSAGGFLSDVWVAMWYVPSDGGYDEVTLRLVERHGDSPPMPEDVMEEWTITQFESWYQWNPPIHVVGGGTSQLEAGVPYWLWAVGGETTWCGWCMNPDPQLTCPHTLRREGENWLPINDETASAFRIDVASPCPADVNSDNVVDIDDLFAVLAAWGTCENCPEDINTDGVVDIDDIFEVLAQWGPCP